jgi:hypothetical protein
MKLVPPDYLSPEDLTLRQTLSEHPDLARRITLLLNRYRGMVQMSLDHTDPPDPSDVLKSLGKCENEMRRLGIEVLDTPEQWSAAARRG